jgi:hypothetical protein
MTNNWVDIKNANVVLIMGGNAAEAHPVGFKWVVEAQTKNDATVVVVDPRFNRSAAVADLYAPIRAGRTPRSCWASSVICWKTIAFNTTTCAITPTPACLSATTISLKMACSAAMTRKTPVR